MQTNACCPFVFHICYTGFEPSPITNTGNLNLTGQGDLGGDSSTDLVVRDEHGMVLHTRDKGGDGRSLNSLLTICVGLQEDDRD